jgi:hypothetical protein
MEATRPFAVLLLALVAWVGPATGGEAQARLSYEGTAGVQVAQASSGARQPTAGGTVRAAVGPKRSGAARVLILRGKVVAVDRDGNRRTLARGSEVFEGDTLTTGKTSQAQLRFTDGALLSLRAESEFRVDEYRFEEGDRGIQRAFFSLLRGGLRTITGLVGKRRREDYRVDTPVATIGKRGTHYALYLCQAGGCVSPERLKDGLYGGVAEGAVAATTKKAVKVFAADQYFHVASLDAVPESLLKPPAILFQGDVPAIQAKERRRVPSDGLGAVEQGDSANRELGGTGLGDQQNTTNPPVFQVGEVIQAALATEGDDILYRLSGNTDTVGDFGFSTTLDTDTGTDTGTGSGTGSGTGTGTGSSPVAMVSFIEQKNKVSFEHSGGPVDSATLTLDASENVTHAEWNTNFNTKACSACVFDAGTAGTLVESGALPSSDLTINWGRWNGGYFVDAGKNNAVGDFHFIYSADVTTAAELTKLGATGSTATFTYISSGTTPTDELGNVGLVKSAKLDVNFATQQVGNYAIDLTTAGPDGTLSTADDLSWVGRQAGSVTLDQALKRGIDLGGPGSGCINCTGSGNIEGGASLQLLGSDAKAGISAYGLRNQNGSEAVAGSLVLERP